MLLDNKTAVIYGGGGSIGGAMARAFAAEGARVFLVGRTQEKLDKVASDIQAAGGLAETAIVDALDERAVDDYVDSVAAQASRVDISVNVISHNGLFGPLLQAPAEDFAQSLGSVAKTFLITTKAAARHMTKQGSGVILHFGGSDNVPMANMGNVQIGFDLVESMRRQWGADLGPSGVRVVTLRTGGIPETMPDSEEMAPMKQQMIDGTQLKRAATLADVGNVAAFVASDRARSMTTTQVNISCGALVD
ncbi:SDR family NAD(P)-dependent oxidoreductase [Spirillospora sp. NPDC048911]|uniref:SDR family NAD(P)-dependent oxidoreductase n=1 Tax=Spirillospora sp. NPDC048911 TaxID=3364527 RepID=UPI003722A933